MSELTIATSGNREVVDITEKVAELVGAQTDGLIHVFALHTTVALSIADMDPGTDQDYLNAFERMVPDIQFNHPHDPSHMPSHILSTMLKPEVMVPVKDGKLHLGTWQRVILLEFDGPRERKLTLTEIPSV